MTTTHGRRTGAFWLATSAFALALAVAPLGIATDGHLVAKEAFAQGKGGEKGGGKEKGGKEQGGPDGKGNGGPGTGPSGPSGSGAGNGKGGPGGREAGEDLELDDDATNDLIKQGWNKKGAAQEDGFKNHGERVKTYVEIAKALGLDAAVGAQIANHGPEAAGEDVDLDVNGDGVIDAADLEALLNPPLPEEPPAEEPPVEEPPAEEPPAEEPPAEEPPAEEPPAEGEPTETNS